MSEEVRPGPDREVLRSERPLDERGTFLLSKLGAVVSEEFAARIAPLGLHPVHFGLLVHLAEDDGRSQQQLADALGLHRNVMVGLVDELEERGLAERRRHPADRRAHAVHLTPAARDVLAEAERVADAHDAETLAALDDDERATLVALLRRVAAARGVPSGAHPGLRTHVRRRPA